jgi:hypothetical protein
MTPRYVYVRPFQVLKKTDQLLLVTVTPLQATPSQFDVLMLAIQKLQMC